MQEYTSNFDGIRQTQFPIQIGYWHWVTRYNCGGTAHANPIALRLSKFRLCVEVLWFVFGFAFVGQGRIAE